MRRNNSDPLPFDPEPERTLHRRRAQQRRTQQQQLSAMGDGGAAAAAAEMERRIEARVQERLAQRLLTQEQADANRSLRDLTTASMSYNYPGRIVFPRPEGANFEIRPQFIQLVSQHQFGGSSLEDPHAHLERFIRNCNTFRTAAIDPNIIRLTLFPFSIRDAAEEWLNSQPLESMIKKIPQHNLSLADQVSKFYDGLLYSAKSNLDAAASGEFDALQPQTGQELIEKMAARAANTISDRQVRRGVLEVEAVNQLMTSNKQLAKQMSDMQKQMQEAKLMKVSKLDCVTCGSPDCGERCVETFTEEEVKAMGQFRNDPYSNTYNPGWRNHPNFAWRDRDQGNNNTGQGGNNFQKPYPNQRFQGQEPRQYSNQEQGSSSGGKKSLEELLESFMNRTENNYKNQEAAIKNLENQLGQMARQMNERPPGKFPSDTQSPRNENASSITTRSGKILPVIEKRVEGEKLEEKIKETEPEKKVSDNADLGNPSSTPLFSKVPFPKALVKKNLEKQFSKFMEVFKKLQINLPFSDALEQMPTYAKFMKDILSRRRKLRDMDETIMMTEECSAIIQKKLPQKSKDLGSFTIPVDIEGLSVAEALCDLGASINLMPLSMFRRLNLGEVTPTMISLQMADRSIKTPYGICEDVLVRVDKFVFPVDFVILDMEEDERVPLILGRPFLVTGRALIDVEIGRASCRE